MNIHLLASLGIALTMGGSGANAADDASSEPMMAVNISGETLGDILHELSSRYGYGFVVHPEIRTDSPGPQMHVAPVLAVRALALIAAAYGACSDISDMIVTLYSCDRYYSRRSSVSLRGSSDSPVERSRVALGIVVEEEGVETLTGGASGIVVTETDERQAGYKAGIRAGDVILSYGGSPIHRGTELQFLVGGTQPGDKVPVVVLRSSERISFNVKF